MTIQRFNIFALKTATSLAGGLVIQIGEGPKSLEAKTPSLLIHDDAFSLLEPILRRRVPEYSAYSRYGVTEIQRDRWQEVVGDFRSLADRLSDRGFLSDGDFAWVHTVDLDSEVEIDAAEFRRQFDDPGFRAQAKAFPTQVADWIEDGIQRCGVLTVYGV